LEEKRMRVPGLEEVRKLIEKKDRVLSLLGMEALSLKEGEPVVRMKIGDEHLMAAFRKNVPVPSEGAV
jgi:hypothetical protein